jgi:hypothetical protein
MLSEPVACASSVVDHGDVDIMLPALPLVALAL